LLICGLPEGACMDWLTSESLLPLAENIPYPILQV
jgi:hypothetical protein